MTETGRVMSVTKETVVVACGGNPDCHACHGCDHGADGRLIEAVNHTGREIVVGDTVTVFLAPSRTIGVAFRVLIVPLLLFLVFFALSRPLVGMESEGGRVLVGVVGMAVGFASNLVWSRRMRLMAEILAE